MSNSNEVFMNDDHPTVKDPNGLYWRRKNSQNLEYTKSLALDGEWASIPNLTAHYIAGRYNVNQILPPWRHYPMRLVFGEDGERMPSQHNTTTLPPIPSSTKDNSLAAALVKHETAKMMLLFRTQNIPQVVEDADKAILKILKDIANDL